MPSRTITVILNANHAKKCAFLLRSLEAPNEAILREAQNKFRVKGLSQIYLQGGIPLEPDADLGKMTWVQQVWVSKGEPYSGPPTRPAQSGVSGELRIIAEKSFVDESAIKQLEQVAALPGVHIAVGMPDLHPGNRFPIGCVIAADGIYPAIIGSDVGCGIALYPLLPPSKTSPNPIKLASRLKGLDAPWSGSVAAWLLNYGITRHSPFDEGCLGTVGGGNHFCEITAVERIVDKTAAERLGIQEGALYLLVHTGSRGLGASILMDRTRTESNPYISPDSPQLPVYLTEHDYAVQWARANRDLVAHRVKECLLPISESDQSGEPQPSDLCKIIDVTHNSVAPHSMTVDNESKNLWLHRKGAAPSTGITPCPGSRGHFSWLLEPTGDGQYNAHSLAHGAGRRHARTTLHASTKRSKSSLTTTPLGSEVICTNSDLLVEEMPEAYKDVGYVVDDMEDQGICRGIVVLRPVATYKIREGGQKVIPLCVALRQHVLYL